MWTHLDPTQHSEPSRRELVGDGFQCDVFSPSKRDDVRGIQISGWPPIRESRIYTDNNSAPLSSACKFVPLHLSVPVLGT